MGASLCWLRSRVRSCYAGVAMRFLLSLSVTTLASVCAAQATTDPDFNRDVRPILSEHCYRCHGPDTAARKAGLRLDRRESALSRQRRGKEGRSRPPAIAVGRPSGSEVIRRVRHSDPGERMPPRKHPALTADQIEILEDWISAGAAYAEHWSLVPPRRPPLPPVVDRSWPLNPIDHFVLAEMENRGLQPTVATDPATLLRRVTLDLTGLPPTPEELDAFLADPSDEKYQAQVDRLLDSPRHAEHAARHWLDLARYADTHGYQYDQQRMQWVWREWVIGAYQSNLPFDRFTLLQIAGDLLPDASDQDRLATGFQRNHGITIEGGVIDEEYRTEYVIDRVATNGTVWMGLTLGCARCHDHKYDPITQEEFYGLYAFFNNVPERGNGPRNGFAPTLKVAGRSQRKELDLIEDELAEVGADLERAFARLAPARRRWEQSTARSGPKWEVLRPRSATSSAGTPLAIKTDGSVLAGGQPPAREDYEIVAETSKRSITAVRLEALVDPSLPRTGNKFGSTGRHDNGNFVLSEFELEVAPKGGEGEPERVALRRSFADHSQKGYEVAKAIDGTVAGNNGWAVDGNTRREKRTAIFVLKEPVELRGGARLIMRLRHQSGFGSHSIGRPRLSISSDTAATDEAATLKRTKISAILATPRGRRSSAQNETLAEFHMRHHGSAEDKKLLSRRTQLMARRTAVTKAIPPTLVMAEMPKPRTAHVLQRGSYDQPGAVVTADVPSALPRLPKGAPRNRLGFARWLVDETHPLTRRVAVNRYWRMSFGRGLVSTGEDFGSQGAWPTHPELLDWLAVEFGENGWDIKAMRRLIVTSQTYRQASSGAQETVARDPNNLWLARMPRLRLAAEEIRDQALALGGLLVETIGGPSVYPYQPSGLWEELNNRKGYSVPYRQSKGDDLYRRSLYTFWKRTLPPPSMVTFDAPEREFCTVERSRTNTPLQALVLLNDPTFVEAARHFAVRMRAAGGGDRSSGLGFGFRAATGRSPEQKELTVLLRLLEDQEAVFSVDPGSAEKLLAVGDSGPTTPGAGESPAQLAAWVSVARMLLNLDETITRN